MPPLPASEPPPLTLQALRPAQARFCLGVRRFMEKELGLCLAGTRILAGFSGGADSTALLLTLHYLASSMGFTLFAAHLDHRLRPSSAAEAAACRGFCQNLSITLHCASKDIRHLARESGTGLEESARAGRYAFYAEAAALLRCDWIAVGHNANDLAEDILMRLIRGAGWPGLSGMTARDDRRTLLRPLLLTPRAAIEDFLGALGLGWIEDESNTDDAYLRNRVRKRILPLLHEENPAFLEGMADLWRLGRFDAEYFASILPDPEPAPCADASAPMPAAQGRKLYLSTTRLEALPKALRLRLYKKTLNALGPGQALMPGLLALDASWSAGNKTEHRFPGGKTAFIQATGILWLRKT